MLKRLTVLVTICYVFGVLCVSVHMISEANPVTLCSCHHAVTCQLLWNEFVDIKRDYLSICF